MKKVVVLLLIVVLIISCSRKTNPGTSRSVYGTENNSSTSENKPVTPAKTIKTPIPKVIVVNDNSASKTFDGRLYYDLENHRYWKNYKDGKYYIYNKSMSNNPDFKKPQ
ncbi:MAG: hypothetical protein ABIO04_10730 [Ferruginibacter sp.]